MNDSSPEEEKIESNIHISIENKALIFHILHYVLWRKDSTFETLLKTIDSKSQTHKIFSTYKSSPQYSSKSLSNIFDIDSLNKLEDGDLRDIFICKIPMEPSCCMLNSATFITCYLINFLIYCLIKYNSKQKYYSKENDTKFIKLTAKSYSFVYEIRDIIQNYEELSLSCVETFYE